MSHPDPSGKPPTVDRGRDPGLIDPRDIHPSPEGLPPVVPGAPESGPEPTPSGEQPGPPEEAPGLLDPRAEAAGPDL